MMESSNISTDPDPDPSPDPLGLDTCEKRAWSILLVIVVLFILGLVMVSFWGGPFESDSYWLQQDPPAYPN